MLKKIDMNIKIVSIQYFILVEDDNLNIFISNKFC